MSDTIEDLRSELFATLRALRDKENPMDIDRSEAVANIGQTIINSAKVEIDHLKVAGGTGSRFIALTDSANPNDPSARPANMQTQTGIARATPTGLVHTMR